MSTKARTWVCQAAFFAVLLPGCLFVDKLEPVNRPPVAQIELQSPPVGQVYIGSEVHLSGQGSVDPENEDLTYEWSLEYDLTAVTVAPEECGLLEGSCQNEDREPFRSTCCFVPMSLGTYTVRLRVYDDHGFRSGLTDFSEFDVEVQNQEPTAVITVETLPNSQGHFVVGQMIWLHAFESSDPDPVSVLQYTWEATSRPPGSQTDVFILEPSDINRDATSDPLAAVRCLMIPDYPGSYVMELTVSDGDLIDEAYAPIEVDPDGPPCIANTLPDTNIDELLFDLDEVRRLEVVRVTDDLDPYPPAGAISFSWSLEELPGEGFRLVTGHDAPYLDLDPSEYVPGQQVRVRVSVQDRTERDLSGCNVDLPVCTLTPGCAQWVTWNIEYR